MSTTEKPKVDVAAIIAKANAKTQEVKKGTAKVQATQDNYRILPGYSKYEFNGVILRSIKNKSILAFKTGTKKFQIFNDEGVRKNLSKEEVIALLPAEAKTTKAPKEPRAKKEPREKKEGKQKFEKIAKVIIPASVANLTEKEILKLDGPNHRKIYLLHHIGKTTVEINKIIGSPKPTIARDIWKYKTGQLTVNE